MRPKLIALNLLLAAGVGAIGWQARVRWQEGQAERRANLNVPIRAVSPPAPQPVPKPDASPAVKYADVATKNLFAADRNPTVIIDPPKVEIPKPMPPLPIVYGTMGLPSGTKAIMAQKAGESSRSIGAGDEIGEFKVLALDAEKVKFEWNGKQVDKRIEDLIDRAGPPQAAGVGSGPAAPPPPPPGSTIQASASSSPSNPQAGRPGAQVSPTERACTGDNAPAGSVTDGYAKQFTPSPFGAMNCRWVKQ